LTFKLHADQRETIDAGLAQTLKEVETVFKSIVARPGVASHIANLSICVES
jgi:hypothetical protein